MAYLQPLCTNFVSLELAIAAARAATRTAIALGSLQDDIPGLVEAAIRDLKCHSAIPAVPTTG